MPPQLLNVKLQPGRELLGSNIFMQTVRYQISILSSNVYMAGKHRERVSAMKPSVWCRSRQSHHCGRRSRRRD
jgi:hypothetical protein